MWKKASYSAVQNLTPALTTYASFHIKRYQMRVNRVPITAESTCNIREGMPKLQGKQNAKRGERAI